MSTELYHDAVAGQLELLDVPARSVTIDVRGMPRPQGSMKLHTLPNGRAAARYPAGVYVWRGQVQAAVAGIECEQFTGPVELRLGFDMPRPLAHYGTGKNAGVLKRSAPDVPHTAPDLDKLVRCVNDAITDAGLWRDDAQVAVIVAAKRYVTTGVPGVLITVTELHT
ncbi:MAG TPA: RusA family crossover junction endodeoxyribonuclease [Acidimicrobiia bacterium]|nr:RusA family crossover junction endodeoxyribonuclease [Acidimicrobiia bacterium]